MGKKALFLGFLCIFILGATTRFSAQSIIPPFDVAGCKNAAIKGGMQSSELPGWIKYCRAVYYASYAKAARLASDATAKLRGTTSLVSACTNLDFSSQNFTGWSGDTGRIVRAVDTLSYPATNYAPGIFSDGINASFLDPLARQTIITLLAVDTALPIAAPYIGWDPRINNNGFIDKVMPIDSDVRMVRPGTHVSVRLGNALAGYQTNKLSKTFVVDAASRGITYSYVAILENPNHPRVEQPSFEVRLLNSHDSLLPGPCSVYQVYAGSGASYIAYPDTVWDNPYEVDPGYYNTVFDFKPWTTVSVDLLPYLGDTITVEFTTKDCALGGHTGYAYIDATCGASFDITSYFCPGQTADTLTAPPGFQHYLWRDPSGTVVTPVAGDSAQIIVLNPQLNTTYTVEVISFTGCASIMNAQILLNPRMPEPDYLLKQNVFTPNGDGINDTFKTSQFQFVNNFSIEIFNRWGLQVFSSTDCTKEWDGKIGGGDAPAGTYFWIAKYSSTCNPAHSEITSHGFVDLFRGKE